MKLEVEVAVEVFVVTEAEANRILEEIQYDVVRDVQRSLPVLARRGLDARDYVHEALPNVKAAIMAGRVRDPKFYWKFSAVHAFRRELKKSQHETPWDFMPDVPVRDERSAAWVLRDLLKCQSEGDYELAEDRFLNGYTLEELSKRHRVSFDVVRAKLDRIRRDMGK